MPREMTKIVVDGYEYTVRPGMARGILDSLKPYEGTRKAMTPPEKVPVEAKPEPASKKTKKKATGRWN